MSGKHAPQKLVPNGIISTRSFNRSQLDLEPLSRLQGGPGINIARTRGGISISAIPASPSGGPGGGAADSLAATITANHDNHLTCVVGEKTIQVAKPWDFRRSTWDGQTFIRGGQSVSYVYNSVDTRTSTVVGTPDELEVLIHSYQIDDEIEVLPVKHETVAGAKFIDLNVGGRNWGFVDPQT